MLQKPCHSVPAACAQRAFIVFVGVTLALQACDNAHGGHPGSQADAGRRTDPSDAGMKQDANRPIDGGVDAQPDAEAGGARDKPDAAMIACRSEADCPAMQPGDRGWLCFGTSDFYRCGPFRADLLGVACTSDAQCGGNICRATSVPDDDGGRHASGLVCTRATTCTDDAQCVGGDVCRTDPTVNPGDLEPGGSVCSPPCATDDDCATTDKCESSGRCRPRTCAECPTYFSCANGGCVVPTCSRDADCPGGYCVTGYVRSRGLCAGSLGVCRRVC
jgi:hypothetical protein